MLKLARGMLQSFGINKIEDARDGQESLVVMRRFRPTFMLVDWEMSPMDGFSLIYHIRHATNADAQVPVIIMSGSMPPLRVQAARKVGVSHFILKPIVPNNLRQRIEWAITHPIRFSRVGEQWLPDLPPDDGKAVEG